MQNGTIFQFFHWYYPTDGSLWEKVKKEAPRLAELGFTAIWLPPAFKGTNGIYSIGYDVYDIYDLGEFDQKNSVRTKYGTRQEYCDAIKAIHDAGMQVYVDIVLNHKAGADEPELIRVRKVDPEDRNKFISDPFDIEAYTKFTFPGRKGKYSDFIWDYHCFSGVDFDNKTKETAIYSILNDYGEGWEDVVDEEKGNYDYLMYDDIEFRNPSVRDELKRWGEWYWKQTGFDGVRLDAVKHISPAFENEWLDHMRKITGKEFFAVGEYWAPGNLPLLLKYIDATEGRMFLFDASLHHNFENASRAGKDYDLTTILNDRTDLHLARLHEAVGWARQPVLEALDNMTQRFSSYGSDAQLMAIKQLNAIAHRQGVVMAFADVFLVLTMLFVGLAFLALIMKRPAQVAAGGH